MMSEDLERRRRSEGALESQRRRAGEQLLRNREALADVQPEASKPRSSNVLGKIWNSPNTALGLAYGGAGHVAAQLHRLLPGDQEDPRIQIGYNAVEFVNNPGSGALTLGNTITYRGDPYDPTDQHWYKDGGEPDTLESGHSIPEHEEQHTRQGELLGPLYLPSNLVGGLRALFHDRYRDKDGKKQPNWHGEHNWNERGPQQPQPVPWSRKAPPE